MGISVKDFEAFRDRFEKEHGVDMHQVDQSNLTFELRNSRRMKWPDVDLRIPGRPRPITVSIEDAEFLRKAFLEVLGAFRKVDRVFQRESVWDDETACSICGQSLYGTDNKDIVDAYKYEFDGALDYIELMHRKCAVRKGYRIDFNGHIVGKGPRGQVREAICTGCMGTGIYKHEGDAREYQCPYCKGSGKSPYPVKEGIVRVAGRFQVTDKKGKPVGDSHPSYSAAQKADTGKRVFYDSADAAVGDARIAEGRTFATFEQFITEAKRVDKTGKLCTKCKKGHYKETGIEDDWDGVLHCDKCGVEVPRWTELNETIVQHGSGYRLVSKKGKNLGDFSSKAAAHKHEGEVEWFKKHKK